MNSSYSTRPLPIASSGIFDEYSYSGRYGDDGDRYDFEERVRYARKGKLIPYAEQFLDDIEVKYSTYGDEMYWSEKQERWLQQLAVAGGFRPAWCGEARQRGKE